MCKLPMIVGVAVAFAAVTFQASARDASSLQYYLNGVDRQDGMDARIGLGDGHVRIASDRFSARKCSVVGDGLCFSSGYMTFSSAPSADASIWSKDGVSFRDAGRCIAKSGQTSILAQKIVSKQSYGEFEFYYERAGRRLVGWTLRYLDQDGRQVADVWMLKGLSDCRCENRNKDENGVRDTFSTHRLLVLASDARERPTSAACSPARLPAMARPCSPWAMPTTPMRT